MDLFSKLGSLMWPTASTPAADKPYDPTDPKQNPLNPKGLKPCCACPDDKEARDKCYLSFGDQAEVECKLLVERYKACMNALGFRI